jgi:ribonucleoside-triphosphate reductase
VSLIGYAVCPIIRHNDVLAYLKSIAEKTDLVFSKMFNVPRSAAITTVKPSGNSSQLYNTPPGANVLHGKYIYPSLYC